MRRRTEDSAPEHYKQLAAWQVAYLQGAMMSIQLRKHSVFRVRAMALFLLAAAPFAAGAHGRVHAVDLAPYHDDSFASTIKRSGMNAGWGVRASHAASWRERGAMELDADVASVRRWAEMEYGRNELGWIYRGRSARDARPSLASLPGEYAVSIAAPVPEPEAWVMVVAGLGIIGILTRRGRREEEKQ